MTTKEFFDYFENKYNIVLSIFQKRTFIKVLQSNKNLYKVKLDKSIIQEMIKEYKNVKKRG